VVTIGSLQAGTKENIIPDEAIDQIETCATFDEGVRKACARGDLKRIAKAEGSGNQERPRPPEITPLDSVFVSKE